ISSSRSRRYASAARHFWSCGGSEVRIIVRHPRLRTLESNDSSVPNPNASARSLDVRAADDGRLAPAARMHVAERQRVAIELSFPEAVGVGEDKAPVVLAGEFADERFVGLLPAA